VVRVVEDTVSPTLMTKAVLLPKLARFTRDYLEIVLQVASSNDPVDLVAGEYDAGVQLGEFIQRDMIAVRVTKEQRLAVIGSRKYFESHSIPKHPQDLKDHACIGFRFSNGLYRWEFEKGRKALTVSPQVPVSFDDPEFVTQAVLDGVGIGTAMGRQPYGPDCERAFSAGAERLVPIFPWLFPLLSQSPKPTRCADCMPSVGLVVRDRLRWVDASRF